MPGLLMKPRRLIIGKALCTTSWPMVLSATGGGFTTMVRRPTSVSPPEHTQE